MRFWLRKNKLSYFAAITLLFAANTVCAEVIEVGSINSFERQRLELKGNQKADVTVYLKSLGEMLDGFKVVLRSVEKNVEKSLISDDSGVVTFHNVPYGLYMLSVDRDKNIREGTLVSIGDFRLTVSGTGSR